jgi:hypothetical protein
MVSYIDKQGPLQAIGKKNNTDKSIRDRTSGLSYLDIYQLYLDHVRDIDINILEIGARYGNSLKTWNEYFDKPNVYSIELNEKWGKELKSQGYNVEIGCQTDKTVIDKVAAQCLAETKRGFDVVIDDGSHLSNHIKKTFDLLWASVEKRGLYIIEDLYHSYQDKTPVVVGSGKQMKKNDRKILDDFFSKTINKVDDRHRREYLFAHFWDSVAIIGKGG